MSITELDRVVENDLERELDGVSDRVVHTYLEKDPERTLCGIPRGSGHDCSHTGKPVRNARYCPGCGRPICTFCSYAWSSQWGQT